MTSPSDEPAGRLLTILALGGTIAFRAEREGRPAALTLDAADLIAGLTGLPAGLQVRPVTFRSLPSADLGFSDILALAAEIRSAAAAGSTGVVITQGTDTLEETAYALDCLCSAAVPVVVTGAMRNAGLAGADGPANLAAAIRVAMSPLAEGLGVLVVMNDEVHAARFASKAHSSSPAAFTSPLTGPIGWISEGRVRLPLVPRRRTRTITVRAGAPIPRVALIRLSLDDGPELIAHTASAGYAGAVIEVFGAGHAGTRCTGAVHTLAQRMPVIMASRTGSGETYAATADYPGSEADLLAGGVIAAGALDGVKARVLLTLLLAGQASREQIAASFAATVS